MDNRIRQTDLGISRFAQLRALVGHQVMGFVTSAGFVAQGIVGRTKLICSLRSSVR